jgi:hypothetical protein
MIDFNCASSVLNSTPEFSTLSLTALATALRNGKSKIELNVISKSSRFCLAE